MWIRSSVANLCVDTKYKGQNEKVGIEKCIKDDPNIQGEQQFVLSWHKDIRPLRKGLCFDVSSSERKAPVVLWNCHGMQGNQLWKYDVETFHLMHILTGGCLDCDTKQQEIFMNPCDRKKNTQKWKFEIVNVTASLNW